MTLVLPGAVFVLRSIGLVWSVVSLVRSNSSDILASVPLVPEQEINLPSAGDALVMLEVPRLGSDFRNFQIQLVERQTGQAVTMQYSYVTAQGAIYGFSTMQVPFGFALAFRARRSLSGADRRIAGRKRLLIAPADAVAAIYGPHGYANPRHRLLRRGHAALCDLRGVAGRMAEAGLIRRVLCGARTYAFRVETHLDTVRW